MDERRPGPGLLPDPTDPGTWIIAAAAEPEFGIQGGPAVLRNVHPAQRCAGLPCVVHNPSNHHMRDWPLNWRADVALMERICEHGIGHPDPDDLAYRISVGLATVHGCDLCCAGRPPG